VLGTIGGLAYLFASAWLTWLAFASLAFLATATAAWITGSGWVPREWAPRRLIRVS
jgi:hypothetical protein